MTDELDLLRAHRPEATGPTAEITRAERSAFMAAIDPQPVPIEPDDTVRGIVL